MILKDYRKFNYFDELEKQSIKENITLIDELVRDVNTVLTDFTIEEKINNFHIRFNPQSIGNIGIEDIKLSEIIFDYCFPNIQNQNTYYHYTTLENAESIIRNKEIWMYNLNKRFYHDEFRAFYQDHNILGYENNGEKYNNKTIMSNIFYFSLTKNSVGLFDNKYVKFILKSIQPGYNCSDNVKTEICKWIEKYNIKPIIKPNAVNFEH